MDKNLQTGDKRTVCTCTGDDNPSSKPSVRSDTPATTPSRATSPPSPPNAPRNPDESRHRHRKEDPGYDDSWNKCPDVTCTPRHRDDSSKRPKPPLSDVISPICARYGCQRQCRGMPAKKSSYNTTSSSREPRESKQGLYVLCKAVCSKSRLPRANSPTRPPRSSITPPRGSYTRDPNKLAKVSPGPSKCIPGCKSEDRHYREASSHTKPKRPCNASTCPNAMQSDDDPYHREPPSHHTKSPSKEGSRSVCSGPQDQKSTCSDRCRSKPNQHESPRQIKSPSNETGPRRDYGSTTGPESMDSDEPRPHGSYRDPKYSGSERSKRGDSCRNSRSQIRSPSKETSPRRDPGPIRSTDDPNRQRYCKEDSCPNISQSNDPYKRASHRESPSYSKTTSKDGSRRDHGSTTGSADPRQNRSQREGKNATESPSERYKSEDPYDREPSKTRFVSGNVDPGSRYESKKDAPRQRSNGSQYVDPESHHVVPLIISKGDSARIASILDDPGSKKGSGSQRDPSMQTKTSSKGGSNPLDDYKSAKSEKSDDPQQQASQKSSSKGDSQRYGDDAKKVDPQKSASVTASGYVECTDSTCSRSSSARMSRKPSPTAKQEIRSRTPSSRSADRGKPPKQRPIRSASSERPSQTSHRPASRKPSPIQKSSLPQSQPIPYQKPSQTSSGDSLPHSAWHTPRMSPIQLSNTSSTHPHSKPQSLASIQEPDEMPFTEPKKPSSVSKAASVTPSKVVDIRSEPDRSPIFRMSSKRASPDTCPGRNNSSGPGSSTVSCPSQKPTEICLKEQICSENDTRQGSRTPSKGPSEYDPELTCPGQKQSKESCPFPYPSESCSLKQTCSGYIPSKPPCPDAVSDITDPKYDPEFTCPGQKNSRETCPFVSCSGMLNPNKDATDEGGDSDKYPSDKPNDNKVIDIINPSDGILRSSKLTNRGTQGDGVNRFIDLARHPYTWKLCKSILLFLLGMKICSESWFMLIPIRGMGGLILKCPCPC